MNIGFFHSDTYPLTEGSSVQSWQIVSQLQQRGHSILSIDSPFPEVINFPKNTLPWNFIRACDALIIIVDGQFKFSIEKFSLFKIFNLKKTPLVWIVNAPIRESLVLPWHWYDRRKYNRDQFLRKQLSTFVSSAIVISDEVAKYTRSELKLVTKVIPNGTDPEHFTIRKSVNKTLLSQFKHSFKVMWAGNGIFSWQGIDQIIQVAKKMEVIDPSILFVLISDHFWVKVPPLRNLLVIPAVEYQNLPDYLSKADVFLGLYNWNYDHVFYNSPMKIFDYMSMEKPVIASKIGQIKKIIDHQKNGLLTSRDSNEIIDQLLYLKSHPQLRIKLGREARKDVLNYYNWQRVGKDIEQTILEQINLIGANT